MTTSEPETYTIIEAGRTLGVSEADIESYVAEGLVELRDAPGQGRVFDRVQMRRLWSIVTLSRDLGLNLPGVAAVLQLREQFERVRRDLETLVEIMEREHGPDWWNHLWPEGRPRPAADAPPPGGFTDEGGGPSGSQTEDKE
jgi:MerR family transcriptional regulator, heat shock protein HspR